MGAAGSPCGWHLFGAEKEMVLNPSEYFSDRTMTDIPKRIAVCFWGICRSSSHTVESWRRMVYEPLVAMGWEVTVFLHTYSVSGTYSNLRAREPPCELDNELWRLWNPVAWKIENQADVDEALQLPRYRSQPDPWHLNHVGTFDNHIRALWSLKQVCGLWTASSTRFDAVLYCRPDVRYLTPICSEWLTAEALMSAQLPAFAMWPVNDRFCLSCPEVAAVYGSRFDLAFVYSLQRPLHSESFLHFVLSKRNIPIRNIPFFFKRIRVDGSDFDGGVTEVGEIVRGGRS